MFVPEGKRRQACRSRQADMCTAVTSSAPARLA